MYNKNQNIMTQEQLRMQMLAGIITESQCKEKINESKDLTQSLREKIWNSKLALESFLEFIHSEHGDPGSYPKDTHVNLNVEQENTLINALDILSRLYSDYNAKFP